MRFPATWGMVFVLACLACGRPVAAASEDHRGYLDNGRIRIGVSLDKGGAITFLAKSGGPNLINSFDLGRQIQMSYYSGPVPFAPHGKMPAPAWAGLGWNPIQTGDCFGHPSRTLTYRNDGKEIYIRCIPMQWPLNDEPGECTFESWIRLDGDTVQIHNRLVNHRTDLTQYPARAQELPAIYTNAPWHRLMTYAGDRPYTGDTPQEITHGWPWRSWAATENWAALLDDAGQGLGIWEPGDESFSGGFFGTPGVGGPSDSPTGYIAPNYIEILDHNITYDNYYVLILGDLATIRGYVYAHAPRPTPPDYVFKNDRQHWYYANAADTGWPIRGELRVRLEQNDPQMIGPAAFWPAADAPRLFIRAAFRTHDPHAQVFWSRSDTPGFADSRSLTFTAIPDGKYHTYTINLAASPEYRGIITDLRLDPEPAGHPGDEARVKSIGFHKP